MKKESQFRCRVKTGKHTSTLCLIPNAAMKRGQNARSSDLKNLESKYWQAAWRGRSELKVPQKLQEATTAFSSGVISPSPYSRWPHTRSGHWHRPRASGEALLIQAPAGKGSPNAQGEWGKSPMFSCLFSSLLPF